MTWLQRQPAWVTFFLSFLVLVLGWQALALLGGYERFILPGPADVARQFVIVLQDGRLLKHSLITISEVIPGLLIGVGLAVPLGYLLAKSTLAERLVSPWLIASQAIPVLAIAPLLTIWISSTYWARVLVAVLVVFFPVLVNVIAGIRSIPVAWYELMRALRATRWQTFTRMEFPAALPYILTGLKIGGTLAVIGALVGEFVQPRTAGLGYLLVTARYQFKTDLVFVVLAALAVIALALYGAGALLERWFLRWRQTA